MATLTFLQPWWLLLAALFLTVFLVSKQKYTDDWRRVIDKKVLKFLQGTQASGSRDFGLLVAALTCFALSSPSPPASDAETYQHSQGWIILADVSRSMSLTDIKPSRISAMRDTAIELAARANANSTTLILYSGDAFVVAPPSFDQANFRENATQIDYGLIPLDGSNLTRALSLAWSVIESSQLLNARLFILSDTGGFNTRSDAAVSRLAANGHRTDIILFGSDDSTNAAPFDLKAASVRAESSAGTTVIADSLGQVDFSRLSLSVENSGNGLLTQTGITTLRWANQSHWILLLTIPLLLLLFYRTIK